MTYQQIAELAGVSTATVSRVLSGVGVVSDERRRRVLDAVEQLEYRSNRAARTLRRRKSDAIGVILSDIEYPFCATIARSVENHASAHGMGVFVCNTDEDLDRERYYIDLMLEERVSGVIVSPAVEASDSLDRLADANIPVVTVDRIDPLGRFDAVLLDNESAARALFNDLVGHGHTSIAALVGTTLATSSRERLAALRSAAAQTPGARLIVEEAQLQETVGLMRTMASTGEHALQLLENEDAPTAFICANAVMALGVVDTLVDAGVRIPHEVAVVGFDDMPGFRRYSPAITVAAQPTERMGELAVQFLFERMNAPWRAARVLRMDPQLHLRESCGFGHQSSRLV